MAFKPLKLTLIKAEQFAMQSKAYNELFLAG